MATGQRRRAAKDALFDGFASVARALSSGRRAEIVELLAQGERTVEEVASEIGQSVANTSHHLRTLARAGLVSSDRRGTHVHYRLASDDVLELWWAMRKVAAGQVAGLDELARGYLGDRDEVATIDRDEMLARLDRGEVVVVDVRPPAEYAAGHLPGAVNVPPDRLELLDGLIRTDELDALWKIDLDSFAGETGDVHHVKRRACSLRSDAEGFDERRTARFREVDASTNFVVGPTQRTEADRARLQVTAADHLIDLLRERIHVGRHELHGRNQSVGEAFDGDTASNRQLSVIVRPLHDGV